MCCCEEVHEGQSRKEMMCEKRCRGSDCVQGSTEMYSEWLMSQHFASTWASDTLRSIAQMDYLPNGSRQSSFLWVVSCASNIFRSDKSEHCCRLSVCFKTGFTSTYTLFFLSLLPLFIIHICFSGEEVMNREIQLKISYILLPLSLLQVFQEKPSHQLQINQVERILATH